MVVVHDTEIADPDNCLVSLFNDVLCGAIVLKQVNILSHDQQKIVLSYDQAERLCSLINSIIKETAS